MTEQALAALASFSLVTLTDQTVSMHRLLQVVIRAHAKSAADDAAATNSWRQIVNHAVHMLEEARPIGNPSDKVETWPQWMVLAPHVDAVAQVMPDQDADLKFASLAGQLAFFYSTQGRYELASTIDHRVLAITEAALPADHIDVALRLDNFGYTLGQLGRPEEALPLQRRALGISEAALPVGHPDVALRLDNLAYTLGQLGRSEEALPLRQRALEISEAALPDGHPDIALQLDNLAYTLEELGRPDEAQPLRRRAFAIRAAVSRERS